MQRSQRISYSEGRIGSLGLQTQTSICRMDKQQDPMYSTGNYIQYPVINHKGKEYEKEYIHV